MTSPARERWIEVKAMDLAYALVAERMMKASLDPNRLVQFARDAMLCADANPILRDQLGRPVVPTATASTNQPPAEADRTRGGGDQTVDALVEVTQALNQPAAPPQGQEDR